MYLIAKGKSQVHVEVLWCPIAFASRPLISKSRLRDAARAFTLFVEALVSEIPGGFLPLNLEGMGAWVRKLRSWGAELIG